MLIYFYYIIVDFDLILLKLAGTQKCIILRPSVLSTSTFNELVLLHSYSFFIFCFTL